MAGVARHGREVCRGEGCGRCRAAASLRRTIAEGRRRTGTRWNAWDREQDALLVELAGSRSPAEIAVALTERFGIPRRAAAVRKRAPHLGLSLYRRQLSVHELMRICHVHTRTILRVWVGPGLLRAERRGTRGRGRAGEWLFAPEDVEAFLRSAPWAYDVERIRAGHPLRRVAEAAQRRDPWVGEAEACAYLGLSRETLRVWRVRLSLDMRRRYGGVGPPRMVYRAADLPAIRDAIREARIA